MSTHPWTGEPLAPHWSTEEARVCTICGERKPIAAFRLQGRWRQRVCKPCRYREDNRSYRQRFPQGRYDRTRDVVNLRQRRRAHRLAVRDLAANPLPPRNWWSVQHAAIILGKSRPTVLSYIKAGLLEARRGPDGRSLWVKPWNTS